MTKITPLNIFGYKRIPHDGGWGREYVLQSR